MLRTKDIVPWRASLPAQIRSCLPEPVYEGLRPFPFQLKGISFLRTRGRAILADDMGLGKTMQALKAIDQTTCKRVLIICPKTVRRVWAAEVKKWLGEEEVSIINGPKMSRILKLVEGNEEGIRFTIVSFEHLSRHEDLLKKLEWDAFIVDEAHRLKERDSQRTEAAHRLFRAHRLTPLYLLTGTPVLNRPDEIWSLLHAISPYEFSSYWAFCEQYLRVDYKYVKGRKEKIVCYDNLDRITALISPYILRRMKTDVLLDLPEKTFQQIEVTLEGRQAMLYEQMRDELYAQIAEDREITASVIIAQITRLKQIAVSADLLDKTYSEIAGAKVDALFELLEDAGNQKVVIFSQFKTCIDRLASRLERCGYSCVKLTGDTKEDEREANVEAFQSERGPQIFLTTITAGGLGITLTAASIAVFMDLYWTPAINKQAEDRLHRIGQKNPVTIYSLEAQDTIEAWILELLGSKQAMFDEMVPVERVALDTLTTLVREGKGPR